MDLPGKIPTNEPEASCLPGSAGVPPANVAERRGRRDVRAPRRGQEGIEYQTRTASFSPQGVILIRRPSRCEAADERPKSATCPGNHAAGLERIAQNRDSHTPLEDLPPRRFLSLPCRHTAGFILELPLKTDAADEQACAIILDAGRNIGNAVLGEGLRRFDLMRESRAYRAARKMSRGDPPSAKPERTNSSVCSAVERGKPLASVRGGFTQSRPMLRRRP
jgi:hypothetical protein